MQRNSDKIVFKINFSKNHRQLFQESSLFNCKPRNTIWSASKSVGQIVLVQSFNVFISLIE